MQTICLDFDGVLNTYNGWKGEDELFKPRGGSREFINHYLERGFKIIIHSTRNPEKIIKWLLENNFPQLEVTKEKPPAMVYIDDRAILFTGSFSELIPKITNFKTHWEL